MIERILEKFGLYSDQGVARKKSVWIALDESQVIGCFHTKKSADEFAEASRAIKIVGCAYFDE